MAAPCSNAAISARPPAMIATAITAPIPPGVASVSRSCSLCHSANASLFDGSKHKLAFDQHNWPECSKCHGNHAIAKTHDSMLATGPGRSVAIATGNTPKTIRSASATAEYFHETITRMDEARNNFIAVSEKLAAKGLDVEPISNQLTELTDSLKKSRTYIHSFSRNTFQQVALPEKRPSQKAERSGKESARGIQIPAGRVWRRASL